MTALELLDLFSLPCNKKLNLQPYEKEMLLQRAKEYKMDRKEFEILNEGIKNDKFVIDKNNIYNLLTGEKFCINNICKLHKTNSISVKNKVDNHICINDIPYSFNKDDMPYFYKIYPAKKTYWCKELNTNKTSKEWREYFNDEKLNLTVYSTRKWKYQGKYSFEIREIKYFCEL